MFIEHVPSDRPHIPAIVKIKGYAVICPGCSTEQHSMGSKRLIWEAFDFETIEDRREGYFTCYHCGQPIFVKDPFRQQKEDQSTENLGEA